MTAARFFPGPLDQTGPFMLTRAYDQYTGSPPVTLLPAETVYPFTNEECWAGAAFDIERFEVATRDSYAVHHWDGTWFKEPPPSLPATPPEFEVPLGGGEEVRHPPIESGLVSCLMVTRDRYPFARLAIDSFKRQTYQNRE